MLIFSTFLRDERGGGGSDMSPIGSYRYLIKLNKFSKNEAEKRSSFFKSDREKVKPFLRILHTGKEWPFKTTESSKHYL